MSDNKESFETVVKLMDHGRRIDDLEADMKNIKPIVYETANSAKQIEKSVGKMEANSEKIKGYFQAAAISGVVGLVFLAVKTLLNIGG